MKLQLEDISVFLSGKCILNHISMAVPQGSFLSVLGASGCGKSTLLKTIAGILPCDEGRILIDGAVINHLPPHKRGTVIVFQDIRLFPHMNVAENVGFPLKMRGEKPEKRQETVTKLLEQIQLAGYAHRRCHELSGGQQQRVALARALAAEPDILLLDEPFSSLDENLRFDMRLLILELHRQFNMTTIMVTHNQEEALSMSDSIVLLADERIICQGTPEELYENPQNLLAAKYFGNANFIEGIVSDGRFTAAGMIAHCDKADGKYVLMARPDDISIHSGNDFLFVQNMYTGGKREMVFRHTATGALIRCRAGECAMNAGETVSLRPDETKLQYYRLDD